MKTEHATPMEIEFLWFDECPNHATARSLLLDVLKECGVTAAVTDIDATSPEVAEQLRFPGSPTIRINGVDVEPGFEDPEDYTPRCRIYFTSSGLSGVPERSWIERSLFEQADP